MKGTIAETMQSFTNMLTLGLNISIVFKPKVCVFVKVWVISAMVPFTPYPPPLEQ